LARPRDDDFAPDERIFRAIKKDWTRDDQVLPQAFRDWIWSVGRGKHGLPEAVIDAPKGRTGVAETQVETLNVGRTWNDTDGIPWRLGLRDAPEEGDHHAELDCTPVGTVKAEPTDRTARERMRLDIAACFRVLIAPT
jgi:hypothetical protein